MKKQPTTPRAGLGLRVRTSRAIVVVLRGPAESPAVLRREELFLRDPKRTKIWQPYHEVIHLPWESADAKVQKMAKPIRAATSRAMSELARQVRASGYELCGAGIVGGGSQHPAKIGNPHIRAHAAEGRLFRDILETGAAACGLARRSFSEKDVYQQAASEFRCSVDALRQRVSALGSGVVRPWREDEKLAALAAWIVLAGRDGDRG